MLWLCTIITHTDTRQTSFRLAFRQEVVIPIEIDQALGGILNFSEETND